MTPTASVEADKLSRIVRGDAPLEALEEIGITCHLEDDRCRVDNPRRIAISADARDIARGLLAHHVDLESLRRWAMFIEAADIEITAEAHPLGEIVLNALWDAAFLKPLDDETVKTLQTIVQEEAGA